MIVQAIASFFGSLFFSVLFNISKDQLVFCGICGASSWMVYLIFLPITNSLIIASFLGAMAASILSQIFARIRKTPVTVFQIPGVIPLVPGAGMYRTLYYVVEEDYSLSNYYGIQTLQIAGSIAIAMILISSFNNILLKPQN
jgi:uncharacterized membrane protein YjjB (DUF3815 family)